MRAQNKLQILGGNREKLEMISGNCMEKASDDDGIGKSQSRGAVAGAGADEDKTPRKRKNRAHQVDVDGDFSDDSSFDDSPNCSSPLIDDEMLEGSTIWKIKCTDGLEWVSAIKLMQRYVDLGAKLLIRSACALDHVNGFIFVEAETRNDVYEACKGLPYLHLSSVSRSIGISGSMLVEVENFKRNLAQITLLRYTNGVLVLSSQHVYGDDKDEFIKYERPEDHGVGEHLVNMLIMWREINGVVTDYAAARKTIETIPDDWKDRAEKLYNKQVVYTSTADAPILNFPKYISDMLYWWVSRRVPDCLKEGEEDAMGVLEEEYDWINVVGQHGN